MFEALGGLRVLVAGLAGWLGAVIHARIARSEQATLDGKLERLKSDLAAEGQRVQARLDSDVEAVRATLAASNQAFQQRLDSQLHGRKLQIEIEFEALQAIWKAVVLVKRACLALRPDVDTIDAGEPESERKARRLTAFNESLPALADAVEFNQPFYAEDVYNQIIDLVIQMQNERLGYKHGDPADIERYWDRAAENQAQITERLGKICKAIRNRVNDPDFE